MRLESPRRRQIALLLVGMVALAAAAAATARHPLVSSVVIGVVTSAAAFSGVRHHGGSHVREWRRGWQLLVAALATLALATVLRTVMGLPLGAPVLSLPGILRLGGHLLVVAGLLLLVEHRQSGRAVDVLLEGLIGASALGLLVWGAVGPAGGSPALTVLTLLPPLVDVVALWLAIRLITVTDSHPPAYRFLVGGLACLLILDAIASGSLLGGHSLSTPGLLALQIWGYCLFGTAAIHPSLRSPFEPAPYRPAGISRRATTFLVAVTLLSPALFVVQALAGSSPTFAVVLPGSLILPILVCTHLLRQVREHARAEYRAQHDPLTGLPNRVLFHDRVEVALMHARRSGKRVAVMFLDLDRFKNVNDSLGHDVGNELLRSVAKRLSACLREQDTVARMGGDEFTILLSDLPHKSDSRHVADKVLQAFSHPFLAGGRELLAKTSIGVAVFPDDAEDVQTLLKNADTAMYRAKARGRDTYQLYSADMSARAQLKHSLESNLHDALERGELAVHYQPQIDVRTGRIVALEALARWEHPKLGFIPPDAFIPLAEESGLIQRLGEWVLEAACRQNHRWTASGLLSVPVAINVSASQFISERLPNAIDGILQETGLDPTLLELELTESVFMRDIATTTEVLRNLKKVGVRCSIDDFGTGFSGLNYLAQLPVDTLKIDRSFVQALGAGETASAIVTAVIALASSLHLSVVAEGVETREQAEFLRTHGCRQMQGFLFARPMPTEELERHLRAGLGGDGASLPLGFALASLPHAAPGIVALEAPRQNLGLGRPRQAPEQLPLAGLLQALFSGSESAPLDPDLVARALEALRKEEAVPAEPWSPRSLPLRVAVGTFTGLVPLTSGLAAANALPAPVQTVASQALTRAGVLGPNVPGAAGVTVGGPFGQATPDGVSAPDVAVRPADGQVVRQRSGSASAATQGAASDAAQSPGHAGHQVAPPGHQQETPGDAAQAAPGTGRVPPGKDEREEASASADRAGNPDAPGQMKRASEDAAGSQGQAQVPAGSDAGQEARTSVKTTGGAKGDRAPRSQEPPG